jgi:hypothetical protein
MKGFVQKRSEHRDRNQEEKGFTGFSHDKTESILQRNGGGASFVSPGTSATSEAAMRASQGSVIQLKNCR